MIMNVLNGPQSEESNTDKDFPKKLDFKDMKSSVKIRHSQNSKKEFYRYQYFWL